MTTECITCVDAIESSQNHESSLWSRTIGKISQFLSHRKELREKRDACNAMLLLEDAMLRDIGVTRANVEWASKLPLEMNAAEELRRLSLKEGVLYR